MPTPGTRLASGSRVFRVVRYPSELNRIPETGRYELATSTFNPTPREEASDGCVSVWDVAYTTHEQGVTYAGRADRRYVVELDVDQVRRVRLMEEEGYAGPLFDVFHDPLSELVRNGPYSYARPGNRGHCGLSGLSLAFAEMTLPPDGLKKKRQRVIRKEMLKLANASLHRLVGAP